MNRNLKFPDRPAGSFKELQEATIKLVRQFGDGATAVLVVGVTLASGANTIRHGLPAAPRSVAVVPRSNVAWWQPTQPDAKYLYITTAGALTADLHIWV